MTRLGGVEVRPACGKDVNIYGVDEGVIDGNGHPTGMWFNLIANSPDILVSDIRLMHCSNSTAKNTDSWDTYRSRNVVLQSSTVKNVDDCVSFKPNSTGIVVQNLACDDSHGNSVGSLGQYIIHGRGGHCGKCLVSTSTTLSSRTRPTTRASRSGRARLRNTLEPFSHLCLDSGGRGSGYVKNVTYGTFYNEGNDWAIESNMILSDTPFKDFDRAQNINVQPPSSKKAQWVCKNVSRKLLHVTCVA
ncbi:hypothetical protein E4U33_004875 [Claviceps sp. LM78 group G4]|nr:hypothetical protein E4U33_004875 [Claviceps sp. LM78 group G4]